MELESIDPERLLAIARSGSPIAMANALANVSRALKHARQEAEKPVVQQSADDQTHE
jgi:hypothetical protein